SWNDTLDERNSWGMSAGIQSDRPDNGAQVSGNYQHLSSAGEWDLTGTYAANDYPSASASWSGSFTATQHRALITLRRCPRIAGVCARVAAALFKETA
ncbi:fimbria/pilus outer membrane usher protein, partial [Staphylococcus pseudintermedius]|uniref:fimbria/pilus outer membrane usher protein n=1 Tax=Staphylococcus pseudintermedius TaxID=283734 RepID=UPI001C6E8D59